MDAEGLRPDPCLVKVIAAARHFVEQVAGALAETRALSMASQDGGSGASGGGAGGVKGTGGGAGGHAGRPRRP